MIPGEHHFWDATLVVDSNVKNERTNVSISLGNETKTFWYRSRICLVENRLFRFSPESALLDQIEMILVGRG